MSALLALLVGADLAALAVIFADPEWAAPINTALLIVLTIVTGIGGRKITHDVHDVGAKVDDAATAAASAAECALIAARTARELGSAAVRKTDNGLS